MEVTSGEGCYALFAAFAAATGWGCGDVKREVEGLTEREGGAIVVVDVFEASFVEGEVCAGDGHVVLEFTGEVCCWVGDWEFEYRWSGC